jgi:hypothetical protein
MERLASVTAMATVTIREWCTKKLVVIMRSNYPQKHSYEGSHFELLA